MGPIKGGMAVVLAEGDATDPRRDNKAFCLSVVGFVGTECEEDTEAAVIEAGVAGPEWGTSGWIA